MIGQLPRHKHKTIRGEAFSGKPGGGKFWWILLLIVTATTIVVQLKKENPELNIPGDEELFETLPEQAKEAFKERYGQPNEDDRECELYYLIANTTMERPCIKCPVWCSDPAKMQILVLKDQIYYIGKTCRQEGEREQEHTAMMAALDLRYQWIKKGTEGYITTIEGSLPLDFLAASTFTDKEAQKLVCQAIFELFDHVSDQVADFDFEALKNSMLEAIETNPTYAEKTRFRVYSDTGMITGDIPEFSRAIDLSKYGSGVQKLFLEVSFLKNPKSFTPNPPKFDKNKRGLHISIVSGLGINQFSSELDKAIGMIKSQVNDFDFDLLKSDILRFTESLKEAA